VPQLLSARERLVTSAETFQEILRRYLAREDRVSLNAAYEALEAMVTSVSDVTRADVDAARAASGTYTGLSARDCLHLAVMQRLDCSRIWSHDTGFDLVGSITRLS
jgi:predicted nucleic acid-binding protein